MVDVQGRSEDRRSSEMLTAAWTTRSRDGSHSENETTGCLFDVENYGPEAPNAVDRLYVCTPAILNDERPLRDRCLDTVSAFGMNACTGLHNSRCMGDIW